MTIARLGGMTLFGVAGCMGTLRYTYWEYVLGCRRPTEWHSTEEDPAMRECECRRDRCFAIGAIGVLIATALYDVRVPATALLFLFCLMLDMKQVPWFYAPRRDR